MVGIDKQVGREKYRKLNYMEKEINLKRSFNNIIEVGKENLSMC